MMNAYILVELGKRIQNSPSDRAFALKNGLSKQNIVDWKAGKSLPSWENMEKLALAANLELWEAVKVMKDNEIKLKEAGFATLEMMLGTAGVTGAVTFLAMSHLPCDPVTMGVSAATLCILC